MPYEISWPVPRHVLMMRQLGPILASDVNKIGQAMYEAIDTAGSEAIHVLVDVREARMSDKVWNYTQSKPPRHARTGVVIIVGDSRLTGLVVAIFSKILNIQIHYNTTLDGALKFLQERDTAVAEYFA
jgi:hypothetical protein